MIFIISNRNITEHTDERLFGDDLNQVAQDNIRVALAEFTNDSWNLSLMEEDGEFNPTEQVYNEVISDRKPCVFFVHGFNQSLKKNLKKAKEIEGYGVNVIAFSWPSNPGPQFILLKRREYKKARRNARRSVIALDRTLEKFQHYALSQSASDRTAPFTLVVHSLGNFLLQSYVNNPDFDDETRFFRNVLLHEADVDNRGHGNWVSRLAESSRTYVTLNEDDVVLDLSDIFEPHRLGNTVKKLNAQSVKYFDFTDVKDVGKSHRLWHGPAAQNPKIHKFFELIFTGQRVSTSIGYSYSDRDNTFRIV